MSKDLDQTFNLESHPELAEFVQMLADHSQEHTKAVETSNEFVRQAAAIEGVHLMSYDLDDYRPKQLYANTGPGIPELRH